MGFERMVPAGGLSNLGMRQRQRQWNKQRMTVFMTILTAAAVVLCLAGWLRTSQE
jgi:hypothetical protein